MITPQRFKDNDVTEAKIISVFDAPLNDIDLSLNDFANGAYTSYGLGAVLYDTKRDPMSGVISRDIFIKSFPSIHKLFTRPGTFEFYLEVFRSIWGNSVSITFDIPSPGVLTINAVVLEFEEFNLAAREIVSNIYEFNDIIDHDADNIAVRDTVGLKTVSEIDALMNELAPDGIFVVTNLTV